YASKHLSSLSGNGPGLQAKKQKRPGAKLPDYGVAPNFAGIADWLNTPGDRPITIQSLRGKVVLVDFWTYSCINCLRTLPQLRAWYAAYKKDGFVIVGVHTPEFAFEHVLSNVRSAVQRLDVTWPVGLDNSYATWDSYQNQYWPADYLVDRKGDVRGVHFGEGDYGTTENEIRELLGNVRGSTTSVADTEPDELMTPETYLGAERLDPQRYVGTKVVPGKAVVYRAAASLPQNDITYGGEWRLAGLTATPGPGATLGLHFHAKNVYMVLTGHGPVRVTLGGRPLETLHVSAARLYTVLTSKTTRDGVLRFTFSP